ncbi:MAG: hypothetical protein PHG35_02005 [Dehalococcoidales bacterium]|nr:hypothetical protein [Dehalococcoidales bacterium]
MSPKRMDFMAICWFVSVAICLVIEGTYWGAHGTTNIINNLIPITWFNIGTTPIPCFNPSFFYGVFQLLTWDYSFYQGGWWVLRVFWALATSPGAVWGMGSTFAFVFGSLLSRSIGF